MPRAVANKCDSAREDTISDLSPKYFACAVVAVVSFLTAACVPRSDKVSNSPSRPKSLNILAFEPREKWLLTSETSIAVTDVIEEFELTWDEPENAMMRLVKKSCGCLDVQFQDRSVLNDEEIELLPGKSARLIVRGNSGFQPGSFRHSLTLNVVNKVGIVESAELEWRRTIIADLTIEPDIVLLPTGSNAEAKRIRITHNHRLSQDEPYTLSVSRLPEYFEWRVAGEEKSESSTESGLVSHTWLVDLRNRQSQLPSSSHRAIFGNVEVLGTVTGRKREKELRIVQNDPERIVAPESLYFGNVALGTNSRRTIVVYSPSKRPFLISQSSVVGPYFAVDLAVNQKKSIHKIGVQFTPHQAASIQGELHLLTDDSVDRELIVKLTGAGE